MVADGKATWISSISVVNFPQVLKTLPVFQDTEERYCSDLLSGFEPTLNQFHGHTENDIYTKTFLSQRFLGM
jgi:hypothetical protein